MRRLTPAALLLLFVLLLLTLLVCVGFGSVSIPLNESLRLIRQWLTGAAPESPQTVILLQVRLPRVLCAGLSGAALALSGAAMQGMLRNPLADGSMLGVSGGASLGAALAMFLGLHIPLLGAETVFAMLFAFASMLLILSAALLLDRSLTGHSLILIGVVFSMFVSSALSLLIAFSGDRLRTITFWLMGSFGSTNFRHVGLLAAALPIGAALLLPLGDALNAFSFGEEHAAHLGVAVQAVKLRVMLACALLIGVSVSVSGVIGFAGLIVPHAARLLFGANHRSLLPASALLGAMFLMLCDLAARSLLRPVELPIGVLTSMLGAVCFLLLMIRAKRRMPA